MAKKKLYFMIAVVVILVAVINFANVNISSQQVEKKGDVMLTNIRAFVNPENGGGERVTECRRVVCLLGYLEW